MASSLPPAAASLADAHDMLSKDAARGNATVHTFDPDASPEEKAAAAGKARSQLKSVKDTTNGDATAQAGRGEFPLSLSRARLGSFSCFHFNT